MSKDRKAEDRARKRPQFVADHLPAPRPGLSFTIHGLEALCLYVQKHNLIVHFRGDLLICEPRPLDSTGATGVIKRTVAVES